jgi:hypothetical protein
MIEPGCFLPLPPLVTYQVTRVYHRKAGNVGNEKALLSSHAWFNDPWPDEKSPITMPALGGPTTAYYRKHSKISAYRPLCFFIMGRAYKRRVDLRYYVLVLLGLITESINKDGECFHQGASRPHQRANAASDVWSRTPSRTSPNPSRLFHTASPSPSPSPPSPYLFGPRTSRLHIHHRSCYALLCLISRSLR